MNGTSLPQQAISTWLRKALNRFNPFLERFAYLPRTARIIYEAAPRWTVAWSGMLVVQGLIPVATVSLSRTLVDSLVNIHGLPGSWDRYWPSILLAGGLAFLLFVGEIFQSLVDSIRTAQAEFILDHTRNLIHSKAISVDFGFYESSEYYDRMYRASDEAITKPLALLESAGSLLQNGITLFGMAALLAPYGAGLPALLFVSTFPALVIVLLNNRRYHRWWHQTTQDRRWSRYFDLVITSGGVAAELRLFNLGGLFQKSFQEIRSRLRGERLALTRQQNLTRLAAAAISLLITGAAMAWLGWRVLLGLWTLGDLFLFYQAFSRGQTLFRALLGNLGQIYSNTLFLGDLYEFLDLQPVIVNPPVPLTKPTRLLSGIRFNQVTFCYPGSERPALQNFDLEIPAGSVAAIVGPNGAGKSTLIKLLCRFYDPQAGNIYLDNKDIQDYLLNDLRRLITVLFQIPVMYQATALQNIVMGDPVEKPDISLVEQAARQAGVHGIISLLPDGYQNLLGKWYAKGAELSAGEWQRIALARAYFRQSLIIVLDEPTSFMDPWAEAEWYNSFRELAIGRTALLITHRFTTAMRADVIHVMQNGRIVESGSHAELVGNGGPYELSWTAQMKAGLSTPINS